MSEEKPRVRELVAVVNLAVCENGHVTGGEITGVKRWAFLHECGKWAWEEANFCGHCGKPLREAKRE